MAPAPSPSAAHDEPPPARPRRLRKLAIALGGAAIAALTLVLFAPQLLSGVAKSQALALAAGKIDGKLEVDSLRLRWFQPVQLGGVRVTDPQGQPVLEAESVALDRTLFALALSRSDLGTLTVEKPVVHVVTEGGTTNVERVFHKLLEPSEKSNSSRPDITVVLKDGRVTMTDAANPAGAQSLEHLTAEVVVPPDDAKPISVKLDADSGTGSGHLGATAEAGPTTSARLKAGGFPLSTLAPLLARFNPGLTAEGTLDADATIDQVAATNTATLGGTVHITGLAVGGAGLPQPVKMRSLTLLPGSAKLVGRQLTLAGTRIDCDAGHLGATAKVSLDKPVAELLTTPGLDLDLDLNLAQFAAAAPGLVPVRAGTELKDGRISASLKSSPGDKGIGWKGNFTMSALQGVRAGKPISWEKPLKLEFDGHLRDTDGLPVFDNLKCEADFVGLAARGSPEEFLVLANLDLDRISARVGDFIDLGGRTLGGTGSLSLTRTARPDHGFDIKFALKMKEVHYADSAAGHSLVEPALDVAGSASGRHKPGDTVRLDAADAEVTTGQDGKLTLHLTEPVPSLRSMTGGQFRVGFDGELAPWYKRAGQLTALPPGLSVAGRGPASATVRLTPTEVVARDIRANFTNLRVTRGTMALDEPALEVAASATYGRADGSIHCQDVVVKSETLTLNTPRLDATFPPTGVAVKADAKLSADLARLDRTLTGTTGRVGGKLAGTVKLDPKPGGQTALDADLKVVNVVYGSPAKPTWSEPSVGLVAEGTYNPAASRLDLPRLRVEKPGLALSGHAALDRIGTDTALASAGTLRYDLALLQPQLQSLIGPTFQASGRGEKPYTLSTNLGGSDSLAATEAKLAVGWDSMSVYGLKLDPAEFTATASKGVLVGSPITAGFGGGVVRAEPTVNLAAPGMPLTLKPGKLIENAKLTPELCASALGYALPAFANAGQAAGRISLDVGANTIPLSDYRRGNVQGTLTVHEASVSGGPMISRVAEVLGAEKTTMTLAQEQRVPVEFKDGRVYHKDFAVRLGGTPVKTTGSVGLDKSLDLNIETPYPAQLLNGPLAKNPKIQQALRERQMRVPVKGALTAPQLDANAIRQNVQQAAASIAQEIGIGAVKGEAEKLKGKLLGELEKKLGGGQ